LTGKYARPHVLLTLLWDVWRFKKRKNMTKKDYIAIAKVIDASRKNKENDTVVNINLLTFELCKLFKADNQLFDSQRFIDYIFQLRETSRKNVA
jgi:hypothetical protein